MSENVWKSVEELFCSMNQCGEYVILRNYEYFPESLTVSGHEDIDLLCKEPEKIAKAMRATPVLGSQVHYTICVENRVIPVDVRHIGDGYYDENWEIAMLEQRKAFKNLYYVLDDIDYFYSLAYHALLQKPNFSEEYSVRLRQLGRKLGQEDCNCREDYLGLIERFLRDHNYKVTNTEDSHVYLNFKNIPADLIQRKIKWSIGRIWSCVESRLKSGFGYIKKMLLITLSRAKRKLLSIIKGTSR